MSDERPRRHNAPPPPEAPTGYRQTRRASKSLKTAKRAERQHRLVSGLDKVGRKSRNLLYVVAYGLVVVLFSVLVLLLVANVVNSVVRWNARRVAEQARSTTEQDQRAKENLLVIGVEGDSAAGFLAMRVDAKRDQVFGMAIPEGAFVDVPGQGFERIGESFQGGPDVSLSAVSNFLTVPFNSYVIVPKSVYQEALTKQSVSQIPASVQGTNLTAEEAEALEKALSGIDRENVALVPMPVKPIKLGDQTYFEPQRTEVADLLKSWWGVTASDEDRAVRVIVYNGAGTPGIAGLAAQQLIRSGLRVVDTKNADNFDYKTTQIIVRRGDASRGEQVKAALGAGEVTVDPSSADVTDVIAIIGKDFRPQAEDEKGNQ